ncbi:MAG: Gfo/Idh/MocA family protein [Ruthenibacterium lactatiformans]
MYAFCDIIAERAEEARQKYGCTDAKMYTDYTNCWRTEIYAVHVLTPNVKHCEISCAAMEAGKHVICEKPMAATAADAKKMLDTSKRTGKLLTIGYQSGTLMRTGP